MNKEEIVAQIHECQRQIDNLEDMKEALYETFGSARRVNKSSCVMSRRKVV